MLTPAEKTRLEELRKLIVRKRRERLHAIQARDAANEYPQAAKARAAERAKRGREDVYSHDSGSDSEPESGPDQEELKMLKEVKELEQKQESYEYEKFLREEGAAQYPPAAEAEAAAEAEYQAKLQRITGGNYKLKRNGKTKRRNGKTKRRSGKTKRRNGKTKRRYGKTKRTRRIR